jgi:hypothetical protein
MCECASSASRIVSTLIIDAAEYRRLKRATIGGNPRPLPGAMKYSYWGLCIPVLSNRYASNDAYFPDNPMNEQRKKTCGARNRQGEPCKVAPMKGKKRCRLHGGKTPKSQNAGKANGNMKHGLYGEHLSDDEREMWDEIPVGDVAPNDTKNLDGFELTEIRRSTGGGKTNTDAVSKRPDIAGRVNWILGRLAQLEKTRAELIAAARTSDDDPDAHARRIIEAVAAMNATEPG